MRFANGFTGLGKQTTIAVTGSGKMVNDTISRQAAIDALLELVEARRTWISTEDARKEINGIDASMCAIHDLPSAERRGRWINGNEGNWNAVIVPKCSICGETFYEMNVNINGEYTYNYCPNCGAKMDGGQNG